MMASTMDWYVRRSTESDGQTVFEKKRAASQARQHDKRWTCTSQTMSAVENKEIHTCLIIKNQICSVANWGLWTQRRGTNCQFFHPWGGIFLPPHDSSTIAFDSQIESRLIPCKWFVGWGVWKPWAKLFPFFSAASFNLLLLQYSSSCSQEEMRDTDTSRSYLVGCVENRQKRMHAVRKRKKQRLRRRMTKGNRNPCRPFRPAMLFIMHLDIDDAYTSNYLQTRRHFYCCLEARQQLICFGKCMLKERTINLGAQICSVGRIIGPKT